MKKVVIIQARMGSTRLPGKVMLPLAGKAVLAHVIDRCQAIEQVDEVMVATTVNATDDPIVEAVSRLGVYCHRGSEADVLSRYYEAAKARHADVVVRVTADCPLLDPAVSGEVIAKLLTDPTFEYVSNTLERSYPRGLDTEAFAFGALERASNDAVEPFEREHVTPHLYRNPAKFGLFSYAYTADLSRYRWTLDTQEDWQLIQEIYRELYQPSKLFSWLEVVQLMEQKPALAATNKHIEQKKLGE